MWEYPEFSAFLKVHPAPAIFLRPRGDMPVRRLRSSTAYDQPVHAPAYVTEVGLVAPIEFGNGAPRVANITKGFAHRRPVHVAVAQVHPVIAIFFAPKVFQVDLRNALPQGANPILRIAVKQHIPNVEPRLNPRVLELTDVGSHLQGT